MNKTRFRILQRIAPMLFVSMALAGCLEESGGSAGGEILTGSGSTSSPAPASPTTPPPTTTNRAPEISGVPPARAEVGKIYTFTPSASDADNDFLEFEITNKPAWATFSVETGTLSGTPAAGHVGQSQDITIVVTDGREERAIGPFRITVAAATGGAPANPNKPPKVTGTPETVADVAVAYSFQPSATDEDGDAVSYSISNRPSWTSFNTTTGLLKGTPTTANVGDYSNIVISANDGHTTTSLATFAIKVRGPKNQSPIISGAPTKAVQVAQAYSFQPSASDPDADKLTYSITNRPTWATFSTSTGRLTGTPGAANVGTYSNIVIGVSDGRASASLAAFSIGVTAAANSTPTISGTAPTTARVGSAYSFQPTAADPDKDGLGFTIQNRPSWATFDTATGRLSGTPSGTGTTSSIVISVSDGKVSASLAAFSITVSAAANAAPSVSGTPATSATVGAAYNFQPSASDANGDTLAWTIENRPSWLTFNTATGRLSGTPTTAGTASNIIIRVSDGAATATLPAFAITTSGGGTTTGSATLSWQAPTQNTDGSALTNLAGYRIVYGTSQNSLNQVIQISSAGTTTYVVDGLTSATWYFAIKAYSSNGTESANSGVASKTIQ
ncbi:MAG TPA: putative Ig domain-containing protein [Steroidobacteraceae bacterium]|nr:putative Ig domain-containing protein [Steroidobacteraceae bacterium]